MKIQMHLFCLIGALATGITDGRISSSSSSSSSKSVGGSAVDVTPLNRRELEPAIEYCTAIDRIDGDGKQRGVVDWQGIDQCHKCEGGQPWWPCDSNLCIGSCTPEAVCDERLRVAAAAAAITASDCAEKEVKIAKVFERTDTNINEMKALISDQAVREVALKDKKITDLEKVIKSLERGWDEFYYEIPICGKVGTDFKSCINNLIEDTNRLFFLVMFDLKAQQESEEKEEQVEEDKDC